MRSERDQLAVHLPTAVADAVRAEAKARGVTVSDLLRPEAYRLAGVTPPPKGVPCAAWLLEKAKRIAAGRCTRCRKGKAAHGGKMCRRCRLYMAERTAALRAKRRGTTESDVASLEDGLV